MVNSIFAPRVVRTVTKDGTIKEVPYVAPKDFIEYDKYYVDYTIKMIPVPVGDESEEYTLIPKVIESKRDIVEVINSQAADVGLEAMLDRFQKTGDPSCLPSPVQARDDILDMTRIPQDASEYFEYIHNLAAKFEALPLELRKDKSLAQFVKEVTDQQVDDYINSLKPVEVDKKEGDK